MSAKEKLLRVFGWTVLGAFTAVVLGIHGDYRPDLPNRMTMDEMRPWLAAVASYVAFTTSWDWADGISAMVTWDYMYFKCMPFLITLLSGVVLQRALGQLSVVETIWTVLGMLVGSLAGIARFRILSKNSKPI